MTSRRLALLVPLAALALPARAGLFPSDAPVLRQQAGRGPGTAPKEPEVPAFTPAPDTPLPTSEAQAGTGKDSQQGTAQDIEEGFRTFQTKVIIATTKRGSSLADVPMTLSWIPAEELQGTGAFSLCDAIQYFPGLECRRGAMRQASVSARGLGSNFLSNRILLLKDGRAETDPWTGIFYPDETTPLTNVKQIEVVRGPGSSLYGSSAFGGVINIITRSPKDIIPEGKSYGGDVRLAAGQYNTYRVQATGAVKAGLITGLVTYHGYKSDGPPLMTDPTRNVVDKNEWATVNQVSARGEAGPLVLDASYTLSSVGRPGGTAFSTIGNCGRCHYTARDSEHSQVFKGGARLDLKVTDWLSVFADAYAYYKRREVDLVHAVTGITEPAVGKRRRYAGEARVLMNLGPLSLTAGGDAKSDTNNSPFLLLDLEHLTDTTGNVFGAFADAELKPIRQLVLGGGIRYDAFRYPPALWRNQADHISPRASVVFHVMPQLTLRANYGHAFRAPTMAELGINQQMFASTLLGNPYLRPEVLDAVELAADSWPFGDALRVTATAFGGYAQNFINEELVGATSSQFQNVGGARIAGVELESAAQIPKLGLSFDVAYQYLDARSVETADPLHAGAQLDYAPNHRFAFRGRAKPTKDFYIDFYGLLVGPRFDPGHLVNEFGLELPQRVELPAYLVANARIGYQLHEGVDFSLIVTNLFNSQYQEMYGFPAPGTQMFAELDLRY